MLFQLVKKQLLLLWRNPTQIFYLLGLPIILILILSMALADFMQEGSPTIELKVAWLEHQNETEQVDRFMNETKESGVSAEVMEKNADPHMITMLKNDVFQGSDLQEMIDLEVIQEDEKSDVLADDSYSGLIEVPENFTYDMLQFLSGQGREKPQLTVHVNQEDGIYSAVLSQILEQFDKELTTQDFLQQNELDVDMNEMLAAANTGEQVQMEQMNPVSSSDYYTAGMAVYLGLYVASTIAFFATRERQDQVFDRILVANISRWHYFFGVLISSMIVAFIQLIILFCFSYFVFQVTFDNILAFLIITLAYAVAASGISVLLTAISYRLQSDTIVGFFTSVVTSIFAFIGGSFFPIGEASDTVKLIGDLTPNGSGLSAYIQLLRGSGIEDVLNYIIYMLGFGAVMIVVAAMSFPKRGAAR
ncbi:ABC transporter permease [Oceanobacillus neutriphilus]|uniref:ABC transporter (ATP-binding protein) -streptolysin S associated ORF n=1 Tax=Oceanobacillus neutriphilus TaxID=531815 RepID=A0ABQ2NSG6_9BACI|nr:ABC transporter permease [Oceanobacillus neutriphilus]GGP09437.1 ABC transporter (ATP-binding protein) - streptolysin S associated ORF [Oceanobacillus neutriphilus]